MWIVLAVALVMGASPQTPSRITDVRPGRHVQPTYRPAPPLSAQKKAWFEDAIDRILRGD